MNDTIILQNGAGAFLKNSGCYLLMKCSSKRKIAPNVWSCIGGHMETYELNDPIKTCLREIKEETGITGEHIFNLKLRYIIIRRYKETIRQNYIYFRSKRIKRNLWIRKKEHYIGFQKKIY
jgi:8-oxo-dGTP diphosphatase